MSVVCLTSVLCWILLNHTHAPLFFQLCTEHDVPGFIKYKVFDAKPSSKTISGLLEFDSKTHAVEVLTVLNHYQIRIPNGSNPYTLKLCFSTSSHL
ncbi:heterogeneous nuclear ribonucleoprotein L-like [Cyprinus carpio]|uniref:Heterogeneous nuclear ribonucleoprotein L-like n=1 Tax=Cyprinus carpio TaxID=7962 RepID=A0A9Q9YMD9_CYPCA|nr:heterogeneous nuclear ribonucleoprotein L-like [Cyprinus carpio]